MLSLTKTKKAVWALLVAGVLTLGSGPAWADFEDRIGNMITAAIDVLEKQGMEQGLAYLNDKDNGYIELEETGFHIFALNDKAEIVFDLSGQVPPGTSLVGLTDLEGKDAHKYVMDAAAGANNGFYHSEAGWPHPTSQKVMPATIGCKKGEIIVCGMIWHVY